MRPVPAADETRTTGPGRLPRGRTVRLLAYGLLAVAALVGVPLFVLPVQQAPARTDVVFVLGAPQAWQIEWAESLIAAHRADALLISTPPDVEVPSTCADRAGTICAVPRPDDTAGEASLLNDEMRLHGWRSATVLTVTPHVSRTRLIMGRCVPAATGTLAVLGGATGIDLGGWITAYLYESAATVKALLTPSC